MSTDLVRRLSYEGLLSDDELRAVVSRRALFGEPAPIALQAVGVSSATVTSLLERLGFAPARQLHPSPHVKLLPRGILRTFWALPIGESVTGVVVAMLDPTDEHACAELRFHLRRPVDPRIASADVLRSILFEVDPPQEGRNATRPGQGLSTQREEPQTELSPSSGGARRERTARTTPPYGQRAVRVNAVASQSPGGRHAIAQLNRHVSAPEVADSGVRPSERGPALRMVRSRPRLPEISLDALQPLGALRAAEDRDEIARIATEALLVVADRAAMFVVKKGVIQGWEGVNNAASVASISRESLRNLWIPSTSLSVFRQATELGGVFIGAPSGSSADMILAAALGGRVQRVAVAPIEVRGRVVAFLYIDQFSDEHQAEKRIWEILASVAEAFERLLRTSRFVR
ncbi:MAG: hypothetical protein Q8Q09_29780 [Deltaproteobacteria bacterium]|nr:hypothetical protein [Deltaproteobacteria bacterium]